MVNEWVQREICIKKLRVRKERDREKEKERKREKKERERDRERRVVIGSKFEYKILFLTELLLHEILTHN